MADQLNLASSRTYVPEMIQVLENHIIALMLRMNTLEAEMRQLKRSKRPKEKAERK